jgi:CRP/FNR family cyclic AMP-dependent transcriptional regulator
MTPGTLKLRLVRTEAGDAAVAKPAKDSFDTLGFLAKVGTGKTIQKFRKNENVFAQGDVADTVFYVQSGKVKLTVLSEQGKEAVVAILEPGQFFGVGCGSPPRRRWKTAPSLRSPRTQ